MNRTKPGPLVRRVYPVHCPAGNQVRAGQDDCRCCAGHVRAGRDAALAGRGACGDHRRAGGGEHEREHERGRECSRAEPGNMPGTPAGDHLFLLSYPVPAAY
jgi:hypothetical protein